MAPGSFLYLCCFHQCLSFRNHEVSPEIQIKYSETVVVPRIDSSFLVETVLIVSFLFIVASTGDFPKTVPALRELALSWEGQGLAGLGTDL